MIRRAALKLIQPAGCFADRGAIGGGEFQGDVRAELPDELFIVAYQKLKAHIDRRGGKPAECHVIPAVFVQVKRGEFGDIICVKKERVRPAPMREFTALKGPVTQARKHTGRTEAATRIALMLSKVRHGIGRLKRQSAGEEQKQYPQVRRMVWSGGA